MAHYNASKCSQQTLKEYINKQSETEWFVPLGEVQPLSSPVSLTPMTCLFQKIILAKMPTMLIKADDLQLPP